jgi:hypothetical protein
MKNITINLDINIILKKIKQGKVIKRRAKEE